MDNTQKKKNQIVKAALKRFAHFGIPKTTMSEIADDVHLTKANLYYYFPDKISLIKDSILAIVAEMDVVERDAMNTEKGGVLVLLNRLLDIRAFFVKKCYMFYIFENVDWIKDPGISLEIDSLIQQDEDQYCEIFEKAKDKGELADLDPRYLAKNYSDTMRGLGLMGNVTNIIQGYPSIDNLDDILKRQKEVTEIMFHGMRKK
ncbi:TetR/AcrR family transcriptional regulator [Sphingobacterium spiritivorum]|uniref:TetR/AcrR family transcriptional regulator n=1 Tax=Sphingobacterium spiritivorum TaxID=258 RepID=UPI0036A06DDD